MDHLEAVGGGVPPGQALLHVTQAFAPLVDFTRVGLERAADGEKGEGRPQGAQRPSERGDQRESSEQSSATSLGSTTSLVGSAATVGFSEPLLRVRGSS